MEMAKRMSNEAYFYHLMRGLITKKEAKKAATLVTIPEKRGVSHHQLGIDAATLRPSVEGIRLRRFTSEQIKQMVAEVIATLSPRRQAEVREKYFEMRLHVEEILEGSRLRNAKTDNPVTLQ
jgi:hypothetical protein